MATYDDVATLRQAINRGIDAAMTGEVKEIVYDKTIETIFEIVYNAPGEVAMYKRRYENGGLGDRDNLTFSYDPSSRVLEVWSEAKGQKFDAKGNVIGTRDRLDILVEEGIDYDFGGNAGFARPFYDDTDDKLDGNKIIETTIARRVNALI